MKEEVKADYLIGNKFKAITHQGFGSGVTASFLRGFAMLS